MISLYLTSRSSKKKIEEKKITKQTRGPRGPWVAHLRKRSKVTVEPIIENPRAG